MINQFSRSLLCGKLFIYVNHYNISRTSLINVNMFHSSNRLCYPRKIPSAKSADENNIKTLLTVSGKYKVFEDADSAVISNTSEEKISENSLIDDYDEFQGLNTKIAGKHLEILRRIGGKFAHLPFHQRDPNFVFCVFPHYAKEFQEVCRQLYLYSEAVAILLFGGTTGVFDVEDLVDILRKENARDVFVVSVPAKIKYVDYICIVTGRNGKHISAMAEFIRKLFKRKCNSSDIIPVLEGKTSTEWIALDLGNIALHIFSEETRELYDLETLWSVGHEYDPKCQTEESHLSNILERHEIFLHDLRPAKE